jgi:hypothetical protein
MRAPILAFFIKRSQGIEMRTVMDASVEAKSPQEYRKNRPIGRRLAWLFLCAGVALAQTASQSPNPCEIGFAPSLSLLEAATTAAVDQIAPESLRIRTQGLTPVDLGTVVYDSNQGVCWLADANLAGHPDVRAAVPLSTLNPDGSTPVINPDGTMDYQTALNWVDALNRYDGGRGWLNHNNWQLPANTTQDPTCSSFNNGNFGVQCTGSALDNLYNVGLAQTYPASVVPQFLNIVWPFLNLQPGLYWSANANPQSGETTFSFNTGISGGNTTKYNFFHVLPMTQTLLGPVPPGKGVVPYLSGPGAGKAVYDTLTGLSWTLNANLPASDNFGVTNTITLPPDMNVNTNGMAVTVPLVDTDGAVLLSATAPVQSCLKGGVTSGLTSQWLVAMNEAEYAGTNTWELPCDGDLTGLYNDLGIPAGDTSLEWPFAVGPFARLQPGFYWGCVRAAGAGSNGPCDLTQNAPGNNFEWSFNFGDGFQGTDAAGKQFYVMVYYPATDH